MKFKLFFCIFPIIISIILIGCKKEDMTLTGSLKITFVNTNNKSYEEIDPEIFFAENTDAPLLHQPKINSIGEIKVDKLNHGNYIIKYRSSGTPSHIKSRGFQITAGEATVLTIDCFYD